MSDSYNKVCTCGADDWVISSITLCCKKCSRVYQKIEADWLEVRDDTQILYKHVRDLRFEKACLRQQLSGIVDTLNAEREAPLEELRKSLGALPEETTWEFVIRLFVEKNELSDVLRMLYDGIRTGKIVADSIYANSLNKFFEPKKKTE